MGLFVTQAINYYSKWLHFSCGQLLVPASEYLEYKKIRVNSQLNTSFLWTEQKLIHLQFD